MAGNPIKRKMIQDIKEAGGLEKAVFDRLRDGETLTAVARDFGVNRSTVWRYLRADKDRFEQYHLAQRDGAAGAVEEARQSLKDAIVTAGKDANTAVVSAVRNHADFTKWWAGVADRANFGPPKEQAGVQVSIEHLHLAALQAAGGPEMQKKEIEIPVAVKALPEPQRDADD